MKIVKAVPAHLDEILALEESAFTSPWSRQNFEDSFASDNILFYALFDETELLCGFYCLMIIDSEAELLNIAVASYFRRCGGGTALLSHALELSKDRGVETVFLEVRESNTPARNLFRRFGFEELGIRHNYYVKPTENAVVMRKILTSLTESDVTI